MEVGLVGNEGMVGLTVFLGSTTATTQAVVQVPDGMWRLSTAAFGRALARGPVLHGLMQSYARTMMAQIAQCAACNQRHIVGQRCARWLLMAHDRAGRDQFPMTHEFMAMMLGVRRSGVTVTAGTLKQAGLIAYGNGQMTILDRSGMEATACECYGTVQHHFEQLFGDDAVKSAQPKCRF